MDREDDDVVASGEPSEPRVGRRDFLNDAARTIAVSSTLAGGLMGWALNRGDVAHGATLTQQA